MLRIHSCWSCIRIIQPDLLARDEFLEAVRLTEAYVFRRAICAIPTNSLNQDLLQRSRRH